MMGAEYYNDKHCNGRNHTDRRTYEQLSARHFDSNHP